ncbi:MAG: PD-(D/E)XK nuclease family protein [Gemmatimonadota bacterium]
MTDPSVAPSRLVEALAHAAEECPLGRKVVVAPTFGGGRELLRRLSRMESGWVGFEVTTPRLLAMRLARPAMSRDGLRAMDRFDEQALMDEALDGALASGEDAGFGELTEGVGFREALYGSLAALRLSGVGPADLRRAPLRDVGKRRFLLQVLERYESLLGERRRADTATVMEFAAEALEGGQGGGEVIEACRVLLVPGLSARGLTGRLLLELSKRGAQVLRTDPVLGLARPPALVWEEGDPGVSLAWLHAPGDAEPSGGRVGIFRAASITDELREVLRRVAASGAAWDDVEIVTPDPSAYGSALHAIAIRLGIPVTYGVGLPVERTRAGRVALTYLDWIEGGFQAAAIRRLLEAGDLRPPRATGYHAPADLARRFRRLRVGWGRTRYRSSLRNALDALDQETQGPWETPERFERRVQRTRGELRALRAILFPALKAIPSVPDRTGEPGEPVSAAEIAGGVAALLRRVPRGTGPDRAAREELVRVLDRVEASLRRRTSFKAALTILRRHLRSIRVQAAEDAARGPDDAVAPWRSEGGHLHLSDLVHGGLSGRTRTFIVGLDADRVPGHTPQDPVLTDRDRQALPGNLPTSGDVIRERAFRLSALISRLRGEVTLSYGAWNAVEARSVSPSPVLLQALRLGRRDPDLTFEDLHRALGDVACAIPRGYDGTLDADDVWMRSLAVDGVLRAGSETVLTAFPSLRRGLGALRERVHGEPGPHQGVVAARPELDPRVNPDVVVSASRLEDLGACPLRYLYRTVLRLRPPDDPEFDPDRWLNALERGSLLHAVFEASLRTAETRGVPAGDPRMEEVALGVLDEVSRRFRDSTPAPGEGVLRRELQGLEEDVRSFVRMIRERGAPWVKLEMRCGLLHDEPLRLPVGDDTVHLRGAVDRVDEDLHGLRVVDYKTGTPRSYEGRTGTFHGGRRLQHALYAMAAETLLRSPVAAGEYHFPTRKGENRVVRFDRLCLAGIGELLTRMLEGVAHGSFVPTDEADDCRFCDFATACRVRTGDFGRVDSPLAAWSGQMLAVGLHPSFRSLKAMREFEQ